MKNAAPRSIDSLVTAQVRRWQAGEGAIQPSSRPPSIAISRLPGSGGAELGRQLAQALGFEFFGIEIVDQIAQRSGLQRELVAGLDEQVRVGIDRWVAELFRTRRLSQGEYLQGLLKTLESLSRGGRVVILGRGSPYVLPRESTLRLLVVASRQARCERMARESRLDLQTAARMVDYEDAKRRNFIVHHFAVEPDDPTLYDLVVNTESLGFAGAVDAVLRTYRRRFEVGEGRGERAGLAPTATPS